MVCTHGTTRDNYLEQSTSLCRIPYKNSPGLLETTNMIQGYINIKSISIKGLLKKYFCYNLVKFACQMSIEEIF